MIPDGGAKMDNEREEQVTAKAEGGFESRLREVLEKVRPFLQMDGGDIELVAIEDKNALVRLTGACHGCPSATYTLKMGVEQAIRRELPDFGELIQVD
jgi:Fe-S cluster biogenesis protein NfuA